MQLTVKEFRHLAQGTQSIVTSVAVIAAMALAWQLIKTYREGQRASVDTASEE